MQMPSRVSLISVEVEKLAILGFSKNEVAKELNINPSTFYGWLKKYSELEDAYNNGLRKRKEACKTVDIDDGLYELAEKIVDELIEKYGDEGIDRQRRIDVNFGYLKCYFDYIK